MTVDAEALARAADLLASSSHAIALTGAGVSHESGVPTFRGKSGLWTKIGEPRSDGFERFMSDPEGWWKERLFGERDPDIQDLMDKLHAAKPNPGHYAMAELEALGVLRHVIMQNGDDLHRQAGTTSLTEVHGNIYWLRCPGCGLRWHEDDLVVDPEALPPWCPEPGCGSPVKTDSVGFGEPVPRAHLQRCELETDRADVFMLAGTSAVVYPVAYSPQLAAQRGVPLIEIDPEPTALSDWATVILRGPSGEVLPQLVEAVRERLPA